MIPPLPPAFNASLTHEMSLLNSTSLNGSSRDQGMNAGPQKYPVEYQILATLLHVCIFVVGVCGNVAVVFVVRQTKGLYTPTYCYLVSLAIADLIVLVSAMPEAIVSHHMYKRQWVLGQAGCSVLVFGNFLGINASSTSILCFTVERYIGICKPLLAQKLCSVERAKKIIIVNWIVAGLYSAPWLGLTTVRTVTHPGFPPVEQCEFRLQRDQYSHFFILDFFIFYVIPLVGAIWLYLQIGLALRQRLPALVPSAAAMRLSMLKRGSTSAANRRESIATASLVGDGGRPPPPPLLRKHSYTSCRGASFETHDRSTVQIVRMLLVIVILFAMLWLPYRALLVYNSLVSKPWLNIWYLLFAKTCIYLNSAINPLLYNAMNKKFRAAFMRNIFHYPSRQSQSQQGRSGSVPATGSFVNRSMSLASTVFGGGSGTAQPTPRGSLAATAAGCHNLSISFSPPYAHRSSFQASDSRRYATGRSYSVFAADPISSNILPFGTPSGQVQRKWPETVPERGLLNITSPTIFE
ncbi:Thyrotropin-releasing hormone receptor [Hypsibius exemplaris]|uniref:Thyrotropin-releasing hormone receptor n=1 Tax=Hypsibius exemplaris TaxID=2072580 RepID=A0A1W0X0Q4_HYPEX|nr:Thyrotropin-releasing hormone receptor [Hypsibius exemplaris]